MLAWWRVRGVVGWCGGVVAVRVRELGSWGVQHLKYTVWDWDEGDIG